MCSLFFPCTSPVPFPRTAVLNCLLYGSVNFFPYGRVTKCDTQIAVRFYGICYYTKFMLAYWPTTRSICEVLKSCELDSEVCKLSWSCRPAVGFRSYKLAHSHKLVLSWLYVLVLTCTHTNQNFEDIRICSVDRSGALNLR